MENQISFIQIEKENEKHFEMAAKLWIPFIREVHMKAKKKLLRD